MDMSLGRTALTLFLSLASTSLAALEPINLEEEDVDIRLEVDDWMARYAPPPENMGEFLVKGGKPQDYALMQECSRAVGLKKHVATASDVVEKCTRAAEAGFAAAHAELAALYWAGENVTQDQDAALRFALKAYRLGDAGAPRLLGLYYSDRRSALYDPVQAQRWLQRSIERDDPHGYILMARYHLFESESVHRYEDAHKVLEQCAERFPRNPSCQWALAENYFHGMGVPADPDRALKSFIALYRKDRTLFANCYAWRLATAPWPDLRNAEEAIAVMKRLATIRELRPAELDTLAAALASGGYYERAVETQEQAIEAFTAWQSESGARVSPKLLARMRERLAAFKRKEIWTERVTPEWLGQNMIDHLAEADNSLASAGK